MARNIITPNPYTVTGVKPGQWFLDSTESYSTLIAPGYLSSVANAAIDFQPNDFIFAQYNNGQDVDLFNVIEASPGIFSLEVYNPNSNSFIFTRVIFVAKGGSDLNPGTSMGLPKLTIGAAITALNPNLTDSSLVVIMDNGTYNENIVLPNNIDIYGPNCKITATTGDAITVNDSGQNTFATVKVANIGADAGNSIVVLGSGSVLYCESTIVSGNINNEGILLIKNGLALVSSVVTVAANSLAVLYFTNSINSSVNIDPTATFAGEIGTLLPGATSTVIYGDNTYNDKLTFQTDPIDETLGRTLAITDSNARIIFNNAVSEEFTLPQTSDVAIPIGTNVYFSQIGIGKIRFTEGAGVTIINKTGTPCQTSSPGDTATAWKYTDTIWIVSGDIQGQP